jgi:hypothetical protein
MHVYHYSLKKYDQILTRDLQGVVSKKEKKKNELVAKYRSSDIVYHESVSFFIEKPPLDIIDTIFPKDHPIWKKGNILFEHVVDIKDISLYKWMISEHKIHMLFVDTLPWYDNDVYKKTFFKSLSIARSLFNESGDDTDSLVKALKKIPKGTIRSAYLKLKDRDDYDDIKYKYAGSVPHLIIGTKEPVKMLSVNKVVVGSKSNNLFSSESSSVNIIW